MRWQRSFDYLFKMSTEGKGQEEESTLKMSTEEEGRGKDSARIKLIKENAGNAAFVTGIFTLIAAVAAGIFALIAAVAAGIFSGLEKNETGRQTLELERTKFEFDLISDILSEKDFSQEDSSKSLLFLVEIGIVKILDAEVLASRAKNENLPTLPAPQRVGNSLTSSADLSEVQAYIGRCSKGPLSLFRPRGRSIDI